MEFNLISTSVGSTSDKILTLVKQKGSISFTELESSINDSYNLIFLAIDKLVSENKISLHRDIADYLLSTPGYAGKSNEIKNHITV